MDEPVKGTPLRTPTPGVIAETVLCELEHCALQNDTPKFWSCYLDDPVAIIKINALKEFHILLNFVFPGVRFTMEEATARQSPF